MPKEYEIPNAEDLITEIEGGKKNTHSDNVLEKLIDSKGTTEKGLQKLYKMFYNSKQQ